MSGDILCGRCHQHVQGEASINDVPYCHQEDVEITCYQRELFSRLAEEFALVWPEEFGPPKGTPFAFLADALQEKEKGRDAKQDS